MFLFQPPLAAMFVQEPSIAKTAIVTGADGQDGSLMVDHILANTNHKVYGTVRNARKGFPFLAEALQNPRFQILCLNIEDERMVTKLIDLLRPDYYLNFAAQTNVVLSKEKPDETISANTLAVNNALYALYKFGKPVRFFNAGSSEEFSPPEYAPQNENHPSRFNNPYGISKTLSHHVVRDYRQLGMFDIQPYTYNHFSPRANPVFLPVKIAKEFARMYWTATKTRQLTNIKPLQVGNLETVRDYTSAEEVVAAIWLSLNAETPKDYVICSGKATTVRELVTIAMKNVSPRIVWRGDKLWAFAQGSSWVIAESVDDFYRPSEEIPLVGDPSLIFNELGWKACKPLEEIMSDMIKKEIDTKDKGG